MKNKRGQAAMDFLMTYGWAILVVLIVIGILAWFIRPSKLAPSTAGFDGVSNIQIPESGFAVRSDGTAQFDIKNIGGDDLTNVTFKLNGVACNPQNTEIKADGDATFNCTVPAKSAGSEFSGDIELDYKSSSSTVFQTARGKVKTKYQ